MTDEAKGESAHTTFDALIDRLQTAARRDVGDADGGHVSSLKSIFDAALAEVEAKRAVAGEKVIAAAENARESIKANPAVSITAAFAAGFAVGRILGAKVRK